jgi:uncharacterized protein (TIGR02453 family)
VWFDLHRKEYELLRKEWIELAQMFIDAVAKFDPAVSVVGPKDCVFKINRDVRFSKDKSPYKTNFGIAINKGGKKAPFCGYYLHIEPGNCFIAGGAYMPEAAMLAAIRQEIDYNTDAFKKIISDKTFKKLFGSLSGEKLARPPKGYDANNPAIEYLKHKSFLAEMQFDEKSIGNEAIIKSIILGFKAMHPLVAFLQEAHAS